MPFNGSGVWSWNYNWTNDAANGIPITASRMDGQFDDAGNNGFDNCLTRDGQGKPAAAIDWNGQNLTNVGTFGAGASTVSTLAVGGATLGGNIVAVSGNSFFSGSFAVAKSSLSPVIYTFDNTNTGQAAIAIRGNSQTDKLQLISGSAGQNITADGALTITAASLTVSPAVTFSTFVSVNGSSGGWTTTAEFESQTATGGAVSGWVTGSSGNSVISRVDNTGANLAVWVYQGAAVGTVTTNGTITVYGTTSDYRLKDVTGDLTTSGDFIDALMPRIGTWKSDGSPFAGLIAHEVQAISPSSVVGTKDGENMQNMDYGSPEIIANVIAELKSLRQRTSNLERAVS